MKFLAVLVSYDRAARVSGIGGDLANKVRTGTKKGGIFKAGTYDDTAIIYATDDGGSRAGGLG